MLYLLVFFTGLVYFFYYQLIEKRRGLPPGPTPFPLVGNVFQLDPVSPHITIAKWAKKYGPVLTVWFGPRPMVFVTDYKTLKETFGGKNKDIFGGRAENFVYRTIWSNGKGISFSDGPLWNEQRRFSLHVLRDFGFGRNIMEEKVLENANKLVQNIKNEGELHTQRKAVVRNLDFLLQLCIGNVISAVVLGRTYDDDWGKYEELTRLMNEILEVWMRPTTMLLMHYPWLRRVPLFDNFGYRPYVRNLNVWKESLFEEVKRHKRNLDLSKEPTDYIDKYLHEMHRKRVNNEDMSYFSELQCTMAIKDLFSAGIETTYTTINWAILFFVNFPEVQSRCRDEVEVILKNREDKSIRMSDMKQMPYFQAVIQETMRHANLLPINLGILWKVFS